MAHLRSIDVYTTHILFVYGLRVLALDMNVHEMFYILFISSQ